MFIELAGSHEAHVCRVPHLFMVKAAPSPLGPARAPAPAADTKRHPGHYRPPPAAIPDFGLDLSDD